MSTTREAEDGIGIEVTESAAEAGQSLLADEGLEDTDAGLRLLAREKNCDCGDVAYGMELADEPADGDVVVERHGLRLVIDESSQAHLEDVRLEYIDDFRGQGFALERTDEPKGEEGGCGCGGHHHHH
jgi:iron-sulfur cluster assembly protein